MAWIGENKNKKISKMLKADIKWIR